MLAVDSHTVTRSSSVHNPDDEMSPRPHVMKISEFIETNPMTVLKGCGAITERNLQDPLHHTTERERKTGRLLETAESSTGPCPGTAKSNHNCGWKEKIMQVLYQGINCTRSLPQTLPIQEMGRATKYCRWDIMFTVWTVYTSSDPHAFYF